MARKKQTQPAQFDGPIPTEACCLTTLYDHPAPDGVAVCQVCEGTSLQLIGEDGKWAMVMFGEVRGWIPADAIRR